MNNNVGPRPTPVGSRPADLPDPEQSLVLSYLDLRKAVGIIGVSLPFVLVLGDWLLQALRGASASSPVFEPSISCYVYSRMGRVFVGSLCAIGVFLLSTRGYDKRDEIAGRLASVFAVCVALFPTSPCPGADALHALISKFHWTCAALLFVTLAYFCLKLFTETSPDLPPTRQKLQRNLLYKVCGYIILVSILAIGLDKLVPTVGSLLDRLNPVFWLESIAVVAFGVAWLTKGEAILKDEQV